VHINNETNRAGSSTLTVLIQLIYKNGTNGDRSSPLKIFFDNLSMRKIKTVDDREYYKCIDELCDRRKKP